MKLINRSQYLQSYILIEDGKATLYGEAYRIKDRRQWKICKDGESVTLSENDE